MQDISKKKSGCPDPCVAFRLLDLPLELREIIYKHVMTDDINGNGIIRHREFMAGPPLAQYGSYHRWMFTYVQRIAPQPFVHALFFVSKQMSEEARRLFYLNRTLEVEVGFFTTMLDGHNFPKFRDNVIRRKSRLRKINLCYDLCQGFNPTFIYDECVGNLASFIECLIDLSTGAPPDQIAVVLYLGYTEREWSREQIEHHIYDLVTRLGRFKDHILVDLVNTSYKTLSGKDDPELNAVGLFLGMAKVAGLLFRYQTRSYQSEVDRIGTEKLFAAASRRSPVHGSGVLSPYAAQMILSHDHQAREMKSWIDRYQSLV